MDLVLGFTYLRFKRFLLVQKCCDHASCCFAKVEFQMLSCFHGAGEVYNLQGTEDCGCALT